MSRKMNSLLPDESPLDLDRVSPQHCFLPFSQRGQLLRECQYAELSLRMISQAAEKADVSTKTVFVFAEVKVCGARPLLSPDPLIFTPLFAPRCSFAPLLTDEEQAEMLLTLQRLTGRPGSFDCAQRAAAGLQELRGPEQLLAVARKHATFRQMPSCGMRPLGATAALGIVPMKPKGKESMDDGSGFACWSKSIIKPDKEVFIASVERRPVPKSSRKKPDVDIISEQRPKQPVSAEPSTSAEQIVLLFHFKGRYHLFCRAHFLIAQCHFLRRRWLVEPRGSFLSRLWSRHLALGDKPSGKQHWPRRILENSVAGSGSWNG
ncbi:hypothetical protein EYF80_003927 [Liparis tanakae]|uniref:Uncharacterized protein n=1 Tax=Liparis tanakae TaxID=230148 RepID=A0A4Z2J6A0_9TELE|nr:hypothetical protein EYF80_003927 [Liparis tanakae]